MGESYIDRKVNSPVGIYTEKLANNDSRADDVLPLAFRYFITTIISEKMYEHTEGVNAVKYSEDIASTLSDTDAKALYEQYVIQRDRIGAIARLDSLLVAKGLPPTNDPQAIKNFYKGKN